MPGKSYGLALPSIASVAWNVREMNGTTAKIKECLCSEMKEFTQSERGLCGIPQFVISLLGHNFTPVNDTIIPDVYSTNQSLNTLIQARYSFDSYQKFSSHVYKISQSTVEYFFDSRDTQQQVYHQLDRILKDNFEFCNATDYGDCYVLSSALIGDTNSVNKYSASIESYCGFGVPLNGSLFYPSDMMQQPFLPKDAFEKLASIPPQKLTAPYFKCKPTKTTAATNAVGNAYGITNSILAFLGLSLLPALIAVSIKYKLWSLPMQTYDSEDRKDVLKELADALLRCRDGETKFSSENEKILVKFQTELLENVRREKIEYIKESGMADVIHFAGSSNKVDVLKFLDDDNAGSSGIELHNMSPSKRGKVDHMNPMHSTPYE